MGELIAAKNKITTGETKAGGAVSQATLNRVGGSINWCIENASTQIGDVVSSVLSVSDFQSLRGTNWVLMDGSDITGSDLANLTGNTTLPNLMDGGALVQTPDNSGLEAIISGENKSHNHTETAWDGTSNHSPTPMQWCVHGDTNVEFDSFGYYSDSRGSQTVHDMKTLSQGGTNNAAAGVQVNFFIKINS